MKFTIAVAALVGNASAWFGTGHLLTARIAQEVLSEEAPEVLTKVTDILSVLEKSDPTYTKNEGKHAFVECATYADDIKYRGGQYQAGWHFIDQPYLDQGGKISDFNFTFDAHNVTEAITAITVW